MTRAVAKAGRYYQWKHEQLCESAPPNGRANELFYRSAAIDITPTKMLFHPKYL